MTISRDGAAPSAGLSRRTLLQGMAMLGAAGLLPGRAFAQDTATIKWWDIFQPLIPLHEKVWTDFAAANPAKVEYTPGNPADMMQSLQLAFRSNQLPDVFSVPNGNAATINSLQAAGWFQPLADSFVFDKPFQKEALAEGFTNFDGKPYSFPIFAIRQTSTSLWFFKDDLAAAGMDAETGPESWDDARKAALGATKDGKYGLILPLQFGDRMKAHLIDLAQAAGAAGEVDWKTGDYAHASQPFLDALEFLMSFQKDGSLHPASSSVDARQGRSRWVAGEAAMFFDGPWNSGVLNGSFKEQIDLISVTGQVPYPKDKASAFNYRAPSTGTFYMSAQSQHPDLVTQVLQMLTTDEYYVALAERMDQPPLDPTAVERANVHPAYKKVVTGYQEYVRIAPDPLVRNTAVGQVYAEMRDVTPGLGEILQGAFSGAFSDPKPILQQYADQMNRERDRAIEAAKGKGAEVSRDDWVFEAWQPGEDFTADKY
ncbi:extracellular solute-binding protein [Devosia sp. PTR5]|uniref:sn-glycerol-3-phosphate-binding periplasmic protein UgpB n=1 Tax=Devosia oryzisoli TaxID=2774138 RepID=A0A927ITP5_9HYPH|nr:extracellular solute-binding protein [Devosia oryzisoli]MBD8066033.1 extracellular solute-binding protein [Devosia oryzisoli]